MERPGPVYLVDDDPSVLASLSALLETSGFSVRAFPSAMAFLQAEIPTEGCLVVDLKMPGMSGLELQRRLVAQAAQLPVIFITAYGDVGPAVEAMKLGAIDFIEKPYDDELLLDTVRRGLERNRRDIDAEELRVAALARFETLTPREREVLDLVVKGIPSKGIAHELGISRRTVEIHRGNILRKTEMRNLPGLLQLARQAGLIQVIPAS